MQLPCSKCKEIKPETEFYLLKNKNFSRNNRNSSCKSCDYLRNKELYLRNKDSYSKKNNERNRLRKTGFTPELFNQKLKEQNGICAICETNKPGGKGDWQADHCHSSKTPRGLLCWHCNVVLGLVKDDPERLRRAAQYLEKYAALGLTPEEIAALSK